MASTPVIGPCRLCQRTEVLKNSHTIPQWAFYRIGTEFPSEGYVRPVLIAAGRAEQSQEQFKAPLLCGDCEQRLGRWDDHASRQVRQKDGSFPALAAVVRLGTVSRGGEHRVGDPAGLDIATFARFASSLIWRASVSPAFPNISLGDPYTEQFRRFLLDDHSWSFPEDAALMLELMEVEPEEEHRVDCVVISPTVKPGPGFALYWFCLFGINFRLTVGHDIPEEFHQLCIVRSKRVVVTAGSQLLDVVAGKVSTATANDKLRLAASKMTTSGGSGHPSSK